MAEEIFLSSDVTRIVDIPQRQVVNWSERGLIESKIEASGAGTKRGYSYVNLLEFGLCKVLFQMGLKIDMVKRILKELREDGEIKVWASNYSSYRLSFATKITDEEDNNLVETHTMLREGDPRGLGGIVDSVSDILDNEKIRKSEKENGVLYYVFMKVGQSKESLRIITPWDITRTLEAFEYELEDIVSSKGMIVVDLGKIKREIEEKIDR